MSSETRSFDPAAKGRRSALGRGLSALIPDVDTDLQAPAASDYFMCDIGRITPNRYQPRIRFGEEELEDLTRSIREQGVVQPVVVRRAETGFELVAGERRLRAAKRAGLSQIPVVVKEVSDTKLLEISIIENIQRENLNPIEEAEAYHRLMTEFKLTQDEVAERVGKSRPAVANFLRLRQLPQLIRESVLNGQISMGHARALLGCQTSAQQQEIWRMVVEKELSVRQTEALIQRMKAPAKAPRTPGPDEIQIRAVSEELTKRLGTRVNIHKSGKRGRLEIAFGSDEELNRLIDLLSCSLDPD
ncbi:ParB/RepB/Spo0J family partition protein [Desulfatirhabdium butyrativorans]|uniref:ParB/RepB/Spo0J family partition protein n=1 Tax=Desulfatirhabdium butyrativorans TaxID=340467 RepID=UPI0004197091|nr:ParB/RepB/Spo0J family partition protein [Desulfatirhabdium butyrativorans]